MQAVVLLGLTALWGCDDDKTVADEQPVVPQVTFPVTGSELSAYVDDAVRFEAVVASPGPLSCRWYVDETLAASTASMTYVFRAVGTYAVRFEASNAAGKADKSYTVKVEGTPMEVEFSNEEPEISCLPGEEVLISAKVVAGDKQVVHEWKVGDDVVSQTADFKYVFAEMGVFTIAYRGVNADDISVNRTWTVTVDELPLEIGFSNTDATIPCVQGSEVTITAAVENGGTGLVHEWKVGDEVVSSTAEFRHTFDAAGTFTIAYKGVNGKGETVTRTWTAVVEELPLEIGFSQTDAVLRCVTGVELAITATVVSGGTGLVHEWKLGDEVVSTTAEFRHTFAAAGTYAVSYMGVNAKQERATRTWSVEVSVEAPGYMFENFEARTAVPGHFTGNAGALSIAPNPCVSEVNSGAKTLKDDLSSSSHSTSGYIDMGFAHVPNREKYRAVRVKVYIGRSPYYPRLQIALKSGTANKLPSRINGEPFTDKTESGWKKLIRTDDWNTLTYDLIDCGYGAENFGNISTVQFRPLSKFDGKNIDEGAASDTNSRVVYYDEIEFVE